MRNADTIEQAKEIKESTVKTGKVSRGMHPNSQKALEPTKWKPGFCPNPGGRRKHDVGAEIARAILENNREAVYVGLAKALIKGNAYVFKELCDRGYGPMTKTFADVTPEVKDADLAERIAQLERDLGLARAIDEAGRTGLAQAATSPKESAQQDPELLPR